MLEFHVDVEELPLRKYDNFQAGLVNVRAYIKAYTLVDYSIEAVALEGYQRDPVTQKAEWKFCDVSPADPLHRTLVSSLQANGWHQIELAIHDKLMEAGLNTAADERNKLNREYA